MKRFFTVTISCFIMCVVSISFFGCDLPFHLGEDSGFVSELDVLTDSMEPEFSKGDKIKIYQVKPEDIKVGDVISFHYKLDGENTVIITHRVTEIITQNNELAFRTKGDHNIAPDDRLVYPNDIIGRYERH